MAINRVIALITDFGAGDFFVGAVKGAIKSIHPAAEIIDVSHGVAPYSVLNAQFVLRSVHGYFPAGTVFMVVVDPGVGTGRRGLVARDGSYWYVLPDNGILSAVASDELEVFSIRMEQYPDAAATFHGRDVFGPVAANIARGHAPALFADRVTSFVRLPFPNFDRHEQAIDAPVAHVDRFGNVALAIPNAVLSEIDGAAWEIILGDEGVPAEPVRTYADIPEHGIGILPGSSGFVEIAMRVESLAETFGVNIEDRIRIRYE